ncbi:unnamed protein product [Echinostoma caproni]|uniref:E3 ubiquitin-protein ligase n=1 Tax=Echinostoma caproni TaxID=27848 RepID=A0A183BFL8_9TREM|nr:unnamed protein product [Echinostoma caproni]
MNRLNVGLPRGDYQVKQGGVIYLCPGGLRDVLMERYLLQGVHQLACELILSRLALLVGAIDAWGIQVPHDETVAAIRPLAHSCEEFEDICSGRPVDNTNGLVASSHEFCSTP